MLVRRVDAWHDAPLRDWHEESCPNSGSMTAPTELHTERLHLRPFQPRDVLDALEYRNDPEFARFLPQIPQPFTMEDAEAFVALNMSEPWDRSPTFAVVLSAKLIGTVNFEVDAETRTAMLGYAIGRSWWGQGIATEAARAATAWAIEAFNLTRLWASTDARNVRSQRVLQKLGMKYEARQVGEDVGRDGKPVENIVYALNVSRCRTE